MTAQELLLAAETLGAPLEYFTDPFRLEGEARFSWRQIGVPPDRLSAYEMSASRWIGAFRTLAVQVGRKTRLVWSRCSGRAGGIAERCLRAIEDGVTTSTNGVTVEVGPDCICVHSDTPNAIEVAQAVRQAIRPHLGELA